MMVLKKNIFIMAAFLAAVSIAFAGAANADDSRRGVYVGVEVGFANPSDISSIMSGGNNPTRCDSLLYPDPDNLPPAIQNDSACQESPLNAKTLSRNAYDLSSGFLGGVSVGYALNGFRVEFEYMNRSHGGSASLWKSPATNTALISKTSEWSTAEPPAEGISDFMAHQFFVNAYYDFLNDSRWTPYLGGGVGLARTSMRYNARWVRKPDNEYNDLDLGFPAGADGQAAQAAAAGTISYWDTEIADTNFGFQFMGGLDYALTEKVSIGLKERWAQFADMSHSGVFNLIRSHAPVHADGKTPFRTTLDIDDIQYWALTVGLKYHF